MILQRREEEVGRIAFADILALIVHAHGITYSNNVLVQLAEQGVPMVICAPNHMPVSWVWPAAGHHLQAERLRAQADAAKPLIKRLWQNLVQAKIRNQGAALQSLGKSAEGFQILRHKVASGDPENIEAQAARRYWPLLMGEDFRRDRSTPGANALLNYGYIVLRATAARAVIAAGLHPSLGLHHHNRSNPFCLVDDVIEPFRPIVDVLVYRLIQSGIEEVNPTAKRALGLLTTLDMRSTWGTSPLATCLERLCASLANVFVEGKGQLDLPLEPLPLEWPQVPTPADAPTC